MSRWHPFSICDVRWSLAPSDSDGASVLPPIETVSNQTILQKLSADPRFACLMHRRRYWVVGAVFAEIIRLRDLHDQLDPKIRTGDGLIYLGNMVGHGTEFLATIDEILEFRRRFIARPGMVSGDLVYLRGAQEEIWRKLLELQLAPNPHDVLNWMLDHGAAPALEAYGIDPRTGLAAARGGAVAMTRWTGALRQCVNQMPGHVNFLSALRRAAYTADQAIFFVSAGIDPKRPIIAQQDRFWWGAPGFLEISEPFCGFTTLVRGFDPARTPSRGPAVQRSRFSLCVDGGCGRGGALLAVCLDAQGHVLDEITA